jgi:hypothetical protein
MSARECGFSHCEFRVSPMRLVAVSAILEASFRPVIVKGGLDDHDQGSRV